MNTRTNVTELPTLDRLVEDLRRAKEYEYRAKLARLEAEDAILAHPSVAREMKPEGTVKVGDIKVTTKFTRTWDQAVLAEAARHIDPAWFPFKAELKEDRKASRVVEERFPELWATCAKALTLKPAKPSVTLVGEEA